MTEETLERWPGYNEQSWRERFEELDRRAGADLIAIYEAARIAAEARQHGDVGREADRLWIGDQVRCVTENIEPAWAGEWTEWTGYVARIDYCPANGVNYTVSDEWPPKMRTDGFAPNQLVAQGHAASPALPDTTGRELLAEAIQLREFVRLHTGSSGHDWDMRGRAGKLVKGIEAALSRQRVDDRMQLCSLCQETKPVSEFSGIHDGTQCRECRKWG